MQIDWSMQKLLLPRGSKPLAVDGNIVYLYRAGAIIRYDLDCHRWSILARLASPSWKDCCRPMVRLLRREPRAALYNNNILILAWNKWIYTVDVETGKTEPVYHMRNGFSSPLQFCLPIENEYLAYWGEYGQNPSRSDVRIYCLKKDGTVRKIYSFPKNSVRHIHNILTDGQQGYYIFTGDNESNSGIYHANSDFSQVVPVACGKQKYRAVIGFQTCQGLLYATDSVNEHNYIYLMKADGSVQQIASLNGSCIYGTKCENGYLFSTTVEPDERGHGILSWFSYRRGNGILSNNVQLIFVDQSMQTSIVAEMRKDLFPMKLLQYGCIQFANGVADKRVILYPVAVQKSDGVAIMLQNHG